MRNCTQDSNESIENYFNRFRGYAYNTGADTLMLVSTFVGGLQERLKVFMRMMKPQSLEEAYEIARDLEMAHSDMPTRRGTFYAMTDTNSGHFSAITNQINELNSRIDKLAPAKIPAKSTANKPMYCNFCEKNNHNLEDCRNFARSKEFYKNRRGRGGNRGGNGRGRGYDKPAEQKQEEVKPKSAENISTQDKSPVLPVPAHTTNNSNSQPTGTLSSLTPSHEQSGKALLVGPLTFGPPETAPVDEESGVFMALTYSEMLDAEEDEDDPTPGLMDDSESDHPPALQDVESDSDPMPPINSESEDEDDELEKKEFERIVHILIKEAWEKKVKEKRVRFEKEVKNTEMPIKDTRQTESATTQSVAQVPLSTQAVETTPQMTASEAAANLVRLHNAIQNEPVK